MPNGERITQAPGYNDWRNFSPEKIEEEKEADLAQLEEDFAKGKYTQEQYDHFREDINKHAQEAQNSQFESQLDDEARQLISDEEKNLQEFVDAGRYSEEQARFELEKIKRNALEEAQRRQEEAKERSRMEAEERARMEAEKQQAANEEEVDRIFQEAKKDALAAKEAEQETLKINQERGEKVSTAELLAQVKELEDQITAIQRRQEKLLETLGSLQGAESVPDGSSEIISEEESRKTEEKARSNKQFGGFLKRNFGKVLATTLATLALVGTIFANKFTSGDSPKIADTGNNSPTIEQKAETETQADFDQRIAEAFGEAASEQINAAGHEVADTIEAEIGIRDGYDKPGMFLSENKGTPYDFANAKEVGDSIGDHDPRRVLLEVDRNQVESFADILANIPNIIKDKYNLFEYKGLSILETKNLLESKTNEAFHEDYANFNRAISSAFTREVELNGDYQNALMRQGEGAAVHENMELVACTTHESGTKATEFYWTDDGTPNGNVIATMIVKMTKDGGCTQAVNLIESAGGLYKDMPIVASVEAPAAVVTPGTTIPFSSTITPGIPTPGTPTPETPTPETPTPPPTEEIIPKDYENMERIDENIESSIEENIGGSDIQQHELGITEQTSQPEESDYQGTEATTVQNETSQSSVSVQENIGSENTASQNLGGANANEYAPVQSNEAAQEASNAAETPVEQAPVSNQEVETNLGEMGIQ